MEDGDEPGPKYDQDFFLALAAKGKDAWNAWRRDPASKEKRVTFAGVDFSKAPRNAIDFSGFKFGYDADFSECKWKGAIGGVNPEVFAPGRACFIGATFGDRTNFSGAILGHNASFTGAAFGDWANFESTDFGHTASFDGEVSFGAWANFNGAAFHSTALFTGAAFGHTASFAGAVFGIGTSFADVAFGMGTSFDGAAFGIGTRFDRTVFRGRVNFKGISIEESTRFRQITAKDEEGRIALEKRHEELWLRSGSGPDRFATISFAHARFEGDANFSSRTFERAADFSYARFYRPPNFDAATNIAIIDFTGAYIGYGESYFFRLPSDPRVVDRFRTLRKMAEEKRDHDLERDLYIEERKAELGINLDQQLQQFRNLKKASWRELPVYVLALIDVLPWLVVMFLYWALADYGRSFTRPALWLIASRFFFYWRYLAILAPLMPKVGTHADAYKQAVRILAFGSAMSFLGPPTNDAEMNKFLFCPDVGACLPEGYHWLVLGQNSLSIVLVFFIGLALRNYFKIK